MTPLIKKFGRLRLIAIILTAIPFLVLPVLGLMWLWQTDTLFYWMLGLAAFGGCGYLLHWVMVKRDARKPLPASTHADPHWPVAADSPWAAVNAWAEKVTPTDWPLSDGDRLWQLGKVTLELVARQFHPGTQKPLLELTVPHALLIIERASRELRIEISEHIPLSHQLTLGDLARVQRLRDFATKMETAYRLGRAALDPTSVLFSEFRREMGNRIMGYGAERVQLWLLQEYVRKVGYYAIELYSGRLLLDEGDPTRAPTESSRKDTREAARIAAIAAQPEPLRIIVLGRTNAGKSSLINALFGELKAPTDDLPSTTQFISPYKLEREQQTEALIFDTPGCDSELMTEKTLKSMVLSADLLLWVTAANRADRGEEQRLLQQIRQWINQQPHRRPPPMVVVMSHIDQLRPAREWRPPYDLAHPKNEKARNIVEAMSAVAADLDVTAEDIVPVCLTEDRRYNVDDALWAAILSHEEAAERVRFIRCMESRKREENWTLIQKQLLNAGRLLLEVPKIIKLK